jgi:hypothetical protein
MLYGSRVAAAQEQLKFARRYYDDVLAAKSKAPQSTSPLPDRDYEITFQALADLRVRRAEAQIAGQTARVHDLDAPRESGSVDSARRDFSTIWSRAPGASRRAARANRGPRPPRAGGEARVVQRGTATPEEWREVRGAMRRSKPRSPRRRVLLAAGLSSR